MVVLVLPYSFLNLNLFVIHHLIMLCSCFSSLYFSFVSFFFFFSSRRRHTRLTCDWSSDVCSSDLRRADPQHRVLGLAAEVTGVDGQSLVGQRVLAFAELVDDPLELVPQVGVAGRRSEERRVGKECRSRWSPDHEKKKIKETQQWRA